MELATSSATTLVTGGISDVGIAMLAILTAMLGVAIGYLVFKFGWRRVKQATH